MCKLALLSLKLSQLLFEESVSTKKKKSDRQCRVSDVKVGFALSKVITAGI